MTRTRWILFFVLLSSLLAACQPGKPEAVTALRIEFSGEGLTLSAPRIIAGEQIRLTLANPGGEEHSLWLVGKTVSDFRTPVPTRYILFQTRVPANQTVEVTFTAPQAAGTYHWACSQPGHLEKGESAKVIVVQPDYAR